MKQNHFREVNFDSVRDNYYVATVAIVQHLWTIFTINFAARTDFHGEFRMTYNGTNYVTKLRSYKNANVHTLNHNSLGTNIVISGVRVT